MYILLEVLQVLYNKAHRNMKGKKTYNVGSCGTLLLSSRSSCSSNAPEVNRGRSQVVCDLPLSSPWTSLVVVSMIHVRRTQSSPLNTPWKFNFGCSSLQVCLDSLELGGLALCI